MNFKLGWIGRILLLILFGLSCGCTPPYFPQLDVELNHCPLIYTDQEDLVRQLRKLKQEHFATVREEK